MQQRKDYHQVPDFNFIPPEYRKPSISLFWFSLRFLLVLVIVAEASLIWYLQEERGSLQAIVNSRQQQIQLIEEKLVVVQAKKEEAKELESAIELLDKERQAIEDQLQVLENTSEEEAKGLETSDPEAQELKATIKEIEREQEILEEDWSELIRQQADWSQIMDAFLRPRFRRVEVRSVKVAGAEVTATGNVSDYSTLLQCRDSLLESPVITRIISFQSETGESKKNEDEVQTNELPVGFSLKAEVRMGGGYD